MLMLPAGRLGWQSSGFPGGSGGGRKDALMFTGFHWWDLSIPVAFLALLILGLVVLERSIGAGYARERRRLERPPEN